MDQSDLKMLVIDKKTLFCSNKQVHYKGSPSPFAEEIRNVVLDGLPRNFRKFQDTRTDLIKE